MKKTIRKSLGIKVLGVVNCLALLPDGIYGKSGVQLAVLSGRRAGRS